MDLMMWKRLLERNIISYNYILIVMSVPRFKRKPSGLDYLDNAFNLQDDYEFVF